MIKKNLKAFSLIELSIAILVIGLLIAGITKGSQLYQKVILQTAQNADRDLLFHVKNIGGITAHLNALDENAFLQDELEDGSRISIWRDTKPKNEGVSVSVSHATVGSRPFYKRKAINNLPAVNFAGSNGSSHRLIGGSLNLKDMMHPQGITIFLVAQPTDNSNNNSNGQVVSWLHGPTLFLTSFRPTANMTFNLAPISSGSHSVESKFQINAYGNPVDYPGNPYIVTAVRVKILHFLDIEVKQLPKEMI